MTRPLAGQRWTFCGVMRMAGLSLFLVNDERGSTRALVGYDDRVPVRFTYRGAPVLFAQEKAA